MSFENAGSGQEPRGGKNLLARKAVKSSECTSLEMNDSEAQMLSVVASTAAQDGLGSASICNDHDVGKHNSDSIGGGSAVARSSDDCCETMSSTSSHNVIGGTSISNHRDIGSNINNIMGGGLATAMLQHSASSIPWSWTVCWMFLGMLLYTPVSISGPMENPVNFYMSVIPCT